MVTRLKRIYWWVWARLNKWRHPRHRTLSPHPWMQGVLRHVPDRSSPLIFVDGGAHDGQMARRFLQELPNLRVYAFEPNTDLLAVLRRNLQNVPGDVYAEALGDRTHQATLHVNQSPMTSSLLPAADLSRQCFPDQMDLSQTRPIHVTTLDDWARRVGIDRIDILKLDLQGYEAQALVGARELLARSRAVVMVETHFAPFYEGSSLFADVDRELRACGYRLYNLYNIATHLPSGHIGSCDAVYIPDTSAAAEMARAA